jgi:hypothetical protein
MSEHTFWNEEVVDFRCFIRVEFDMLTATRPVYLLVLLGNEILFMQFFLPWRSTRYTSEDIPIVCPKLTTFQYLLTEV